MASIQRLTSPLTGRVSFRAQVRLKGHPSQSATLPSRRDALRWASSIESAIREDRHFPQTRAHRVRFSALAQRYRETVLAGATGSKLANTERHINWWLERFDVLTLAEITSDRVAEARDALASQTFTRGTARNAQDGPEIVARAYIRSGATVNRYLATLSHMFTTAMREWRLVDRNPVREIARKKEARGRTRFLLDEEREALLQACANSAWAGLYALVLLAISTGARRGELIRLRWTDITLDSPSPQAILEDTKNGDSRQLPLVGRALEAVKALKLADGGSSFLFPSRSRTDMPYRSFDAHWYAALATAAITDFRFHDLRHTCASYLAAQGASLLEIADVLGHRTMTMVKRYSHLAQGHKATVIARMTKERGL